MLKTILSVLFHLTLLCTAGAQVFQVDTLQYRGNTDKYINIVILGDGYTAAEQNKLAADAEGLSDYLFGQAPWSNYAGYFNVFAIRVISAQSGAKHPNTSTDCNTASPLVPVSNPDTYLGCSFDSYGIHRLVTANKTSNVVNVLATNFPNYDQVLIMANSPYYGGAGGTFATSTTHEASPEVTAHEIGHSFAFLADEYYAGDVYAFEKPNMTKQSNPALVKWKNWVGTNGVGVVQHCCGGNSALWYKPHNGCKMQALNSPYCSVCREAIVEKIHTLVNPVVAYSPPTGVINSPNQFLPFQLTELMKPAPNTLKIDWKLNGATIAGNTDSVLIDQNALTNGAHTLVVSVTDTNALLRVDNHAALHINQVSWTINKTTTGIQVKDDAGKISCAVYPNPANDRLHFSIGTERKGRVSFCVLYADGKTAVPVAGATLVDGQYAGSVDVSGLAPGAYYFVVQVGGMEYARVFVKG